MEGIPRDALRHFGGAPAGEMTRTPFHRIPVVWRCSLKPADTPVERALISLIGEAPYGPSFTHSDKWGRPPMHHLALESKI